MLKIKRKKVKPMGLNDVTIIDDSRLKKAITAAALGNAMEWFDFGVYGYVATVLGKVFFPNASPGIQIIAALATFSVPFIVRPIGGMFFGKLGDKYGRQQILAMTIILMTLSTFCIGLIPSYATIGIWAPILLLIAKMVQGFSVGGEYTGASIFVAEYSPDRKRGFMGSWLDFGSLVGFICGAGIVVILNAVLGQETFNEWGWRIPFFLALPLGLIGLYLRHALEETPAFQKHVESLEEGSKQGLSEGPSVPFKEVARKHWRNLISCIGIVITTNVAYYMLLTYVPSYLSHDLHYSENRGVMIIVVIMIAMLFVQPMMGLLSDKFGRRPFIIIGSLAMVLFSIPSFMLITHHSLVALFFGLLIQAIILNCLIGVMASTLPAMFPTEVRYSALASTYNISILVAGITPTLTAWLVEMTGNLYMPGWYLVVVGVIGVVTGVTMRETANKPLYGGTPAASSLEEAKELLQEHHDGIEQRIEDIDQQLEELKQKRSNLVDQHPNIDH
ncbi:glycine betaine/L-proline transporter ProP [Rosenbergiella australiborealis]|uniref:Glycine betaine/L-proline transporter ProP n=1 Tax=Rosenbergiella australiborealis TaxID=1544696 RepID=A0ABS5T467_9GAMM|nr:glycine betaine/L-proline transporter ProP [Rosenbergiella australiborealis]MBT0727144.1 glycine betaine/L-proline transporter ProP [Rosenbergiella australiborealis]